MGCVRKKWLASYAIDHPQMSGSIDPGDRTIDRSELGIVELAERLATKKQALGKSCQ